MGLRDILDAATPGPWVLTEPEDSWHFKLASIICLGTSGSDDLDLAALAPELAALCLEMGEALRTMAYWDVTTENMRCPLCESKDEDHDAGCPIPVLLARLDRIGKEQT